MTQISSRRMLVVVATIVVSSFLFLQQPNLHLESEGLLLEQLSRVEMLACLLFSAEWERTHAQTREEAVLRENTITGVVRSYLSRKCITGLRTHIVGLD